MFVEIPEADIVTPAPVPEPKTDGSKSNTSPSTYPDPLDMKLTSVIVPPVPTTTFAVAPSQVVVPSLSSLTL